MSPLELKRLLRQLREGLRADPKEQQLARLFRDWSSSLESPELEPSERRVSPSAALADDPQVLPRSDRPEARPRDRR